MRLHYILPVHNEAAILEANVERLCGRLRAYDSQVLLVENGSRDDSWNVCQRIAEKTKGLSVLPFREPNAGLGYALHRGLHELVERNEKGTAVLTAADLPFGFGDLDGVLAHPHAETATFVGSKAHAQSRIESTPGRTVATHGFRLARRLILGMKTQDSQGSIFIPVAEAREVLKLVRSRDFFFSTELLYFVERRGSEVVEVPVAKESEQRPSTVKPIKDGTKMLRALVELRWRTRDKS